jgi:hypothetical protein
MVQVGALMREFVLEEGFALKYGVIDPELAGLDRGPAHFSCHLELYDGRQHASP